MSRLYLIVLFSLISLLSHSQNEVSKYLKFADEQYNKGDFYYALEYYKAAMLLDSSDLNIRWKYAETLRAYKDYRQAEEHYEKLLLLDEKILFPNCMLYLGMMQKNNGKYDQALETFKNCKKKFFKDRKSYLYLKAKQEIESCLWAKSAVKDTLDLLFSSLPDEVNTKDAEFGHTIHDGKFIFSSLRADSIPSNEEVYSTDYRTLLYSSKMEDSTFQHAQLLNALAFSNSNTGNGSFSLDGKRYYFSKCTSTGDSYTCAIMVAQYKDGQWLAVDSLPAIINSPTANTTMPHIGKFNGVETLFFASNRAETKGAMDLFYSTIKNGNQYSKPKAIKAINSIEDELSPWWNEKEQRLYFSSAWHDGFGGTDVHFSPYTTQFEKAVNAGIPINSSANDLYYFQQGDTAYVSSNRLGVRFSKNPTCCSDVFMAHPPILQEIVLPTPKETLADLNKRLPVTLYFHNDEPNPKNTDTLTKLNYMTTYTRYRDMLNIYQTEYSSGLSDDKSEEAKEDIESFFIEYVDQGVKDLDLFRELLLEELQKGAKLRLTIKGFASPLAKTDYNVKLTKRRISSLINYLNEYDNGVFIPYIQGTAENGGKVEFAHIPFGEYTANQLTSDNPNDQKNSIYSRNAAIERKIEIQSVNYMDTISTDLKVEEEVITLVASVQVQDLGKVKPTEILERSFTITNTGTQPIELETPRVPCDCNTATLEKTTLQPGESTTLKMTFDPENYRGQTVKSTYLQVKGQKGELRLVLTAEIVE